MRSSYAAVALYVVGCWGSTDTHRDADAGSDAMTDGGADLPSADSSDYDDAPFGADDGEIESGDTTAEDADGADAPGDADDVGDWEAVPESCVESGRFPAGTVVCGRSNPVCPADVSYCCNTSGCGSMEGGQDGCCAEPTCGTGHTVGYVCVEAVDPSARRLCTRPEEEFRCSSDLRYCCWLFGGPAACADHPLLGWTCEDQWP